MIESIRGQLRKGGTKVFLWLVLVLFMLSSFVGLVKFGRRMKADSIAQINDQDIGLMEFRRKYAQFMQVVRYIKSQYGAQADMILKMYGVGADPQQATLEALIQEKVLQSAANNTIPQVSKEYVQAKLRDQMFVNEHLRDLIPPQAFVAGALDVTALKYYLARQNIPEEEFEESLDEAMKRSLLQRLVEGAVYVPQSQLRQMYTQQNSKKKFTIVALALDDYLKKIAQNQSDEDIQKYFNQHKEAYRIPEKRSARLWTFDPANFGVVVNDKDLQSEYYKRKRSYIDKPEEHEIIQIVMPFTEKNKIEVRGKMQEIFKQVKEKPETFEAVAQQKSQGKTKGKIGIKKGDKGPVVDHYIGTLKTGEISPVFETAEGFMIIKLVGKKEPVFKSLDKVKDELLKTMKQEKFVQDFNTAAQRIISQAQDTPEILTRFIEDKKAQSSTVENTTRDGSVKTERLFGLSKVGDRAFYQEDGKGYVIEMTALTPSSIPALANVKDKVEQDLRKQKAQDALKADQQAIENAVKDKKSSLEDAANKHKATNFATLIKTDWIDPKDYSGFTKLKLAVPLHVLSGMNTVSSVITHTLPNNGFVVQLTEIEPFDEKAFENSKSSLQAQLYRQQSPELLNAFMKGLRDQAKIKVDENLVKQAASGL